LTKSPAKIRSKSLRRKISRINSLASATLTTCDLVEHPKVNEKQRLHKKAGCQQCVNENKESQQSLGLGSTSFTYVYSTSLLALLFNVWYSLGTITYRDSITQFTMEKKFKFRQCEYRAKSSYRPISIDPHGLNRGNFTETESGINGEAPVAETRIICCVSTARIDHGVYFIICSTTTCNLVYCGPNRPITSARSS